MFALERFLLLNYCVLFCRPVIRYGEKHCAQASICARFNRNGSQIIALRRRLPPVLYDTHSSKPVCQVINNFFHLDITRFLGKKCSVIQRMEGWISSQLMFSRNHWVKYYLAFFSLRSLG